MKTMIKETATKFIMTETFFNENVKEVDIDNIENIIFTDKEVEVISDEDFEY